MEKYNTENIDFSCENVICNKLISNPRNVKNFICLLFKQYLYRKRCFKEIPKYEEFETIVIQIKNVELYIATKNNRINKHLKKWNLTLNTTRVSYQERHYIEQYLHKM